MAKAYIEPSVLTHGSYKIMIIGDSAQAVRDEYQNLEKDWSFTGRILSPIHSNGEWVYWGTAKVRKPT